MHYEIISVGSTVIIEQQGIQVEIRSDKLFRRVGATTSNWQMQAEGFTLGETISAWITTWIANDANKPSNSISGSFRIK